MIQELGGQQATASALPSHWPPSRFGHWAVSPLICSSCIWSRLCWRVGLPDRRSQDTHGMPLGVGAEHNAAAQAAKRFPQHRRLIILQLRREAIRNIVSARQSLLKRPLVQCEQTVGRALASVLPQRVAKVDVGKPSITIRPSHHRIDGCLVGLRCNGVMV
jgi:hypothetical protein